MSRTDRQYLRKKGPERVILFGSKSFHVYVCYANARYCDAMFLVKKKKCAGHTYYSAVSPPSEFYNIQIDCSKVKCLICGCIVGRLDSKIDSVVLDIEKIRLVRIEPRNLTAVCASKDSDHPHEMLVSSAYCDTVYKTYTKPEFYSVSRYQTLKQPCSLLPDKILGFNFISSISRSFRYIRVHRFRHPSSLRGVYNPLSFANLQINTFVPSSTPESTVLSDSSTISTDSMPSTSHALNTIPSAESIDFEHSVTSPPTGGFASNVEFKNTYCREGFFGYSSHGSPEQTVRSYTPNVYSDLSKNDGSVENTRDVGSVSSFSGYCHDLAVPGSSAVSEDNRMSVSTTSSQRYYNECEIPSDFDMVHFD